MAETRGCLGRIGIMAVFLVPVALIDLLFLPFWLGRDIATMLVYITMGLGLLPLLVVPTMIVYLNPIAITLAVRSSGVFRPAVAWIVGLCMILATAVGPSLASHAIEAASVVGVHPSFGVPPRTAPRQLRMITTRQSCDPLCMQLLFMGDLDALELRVDHGKEAGSTVYRRVDAMPCPPWEGARPPHNLDAFERTGQCLVAEPGATLDAPWVAWTEQELWPSSSYNARRLRVLEWGVGASADGRVTYIDRRPITVPTRFTLTGLSSVEISLARDAVRHKRELPQLLREVMGYKLAELVEPPSAPTDVIRHYLNKEGPLRKDQLSAVGKAVSSLQTTPDDEELLRRLLTDSRISGVFGALTHVARKRPEVFSPHIELVIGIVEDEERPSFDRSEAAELLRALPPSEIEPVGPRILALLQPPLSTKSRGIHFPLLHTVGRLGIDPSAVLGPALASDRGDVRIAASWALCNADARWASPHLDAAEHALQAHHERTATTQLARALVRHGRPEVVERYLSSLDDDDRKRLQPNIERSWSDPPGGCWP